METSSQYWLTVMATGAFLAACLIITVCGLLFDFMLERPHFARTGRPLMEPAVHLPLLTGFYCGRRLITPGWAISRAHETYIHLASEPIQLAALINAIALLLTLVAGIAAYATLSG